MRHLPAQTKDHFSFLDSDVVTLNSDAPPGPRRPRLGTDRLRVLAICGVCVAITLIVAVTGPFGTYDEGGLGQRLVYWSVANAAALLIAFGLKYAVRGLLTTRQFWVGELNIIVGTTLIFTPVLYLWTLYWFPQLQASPPDILMMGGNVLLICAVISTLRYGLAFLVSLSGTPAPIQPLPRLVDRVPDTLRGPVIRLEAEGHFVLIVTRQGQARVRLRLGDAVREMAPVAGHWVHRSHWVAADAITGALDDTARSSLFLSNGDQVPISRTYKSALQEAGVI